MINYSFIPLDRPIWIERNSGKWFKAYYSHSELLIYSDIHLLYFLDKVADKLIFVDFIEEYLIEHYLLEKEAKRREC